MGVMATWCALCALPTQHDHYVEAAEEPGSFRGMRKIYRTLRDGQAPHQWAPSERPFLFDERHAWLAEAVAIEDGSDRAMRGRTSDGGFIRSKAEGDDDDDDDDELFVGDGVDEDAIVYHQACWERMGGPARSEDAATTRDTYEWSWLAPYHEQLFAFHELADDGRQWMLEDPKSSTRSASRIDGLVQLAREASQRDKSLAHRDLWSGRAVRGEGGVRLAVVRRRSGLGAADHATFGHVVWVEKAFPSAVGVHPDLDLLERALKELVEPEGRALLTGVRHTTTGARYTIHAGDGEATLQLIKAMPTIDVVAEAKLGTSADPDGEVFRSLMEL